MPAGGKNMAPVVRMVVAGFLALQIAGCATSYQPRGTGGGYQDERLSEDTYRVAYFSGGQTPYPVVLKYFLYRCAEVALAAGYPYFEIYSTERDDETRSATTIGIVRMYRADIMAGAPTLFSAREVITVLGTDVRSANPSRTIPTRFRAIAGKFPTLVVREVKQAPRPAAGAVKLEDLEGLMKK